MHTALWVLGSLVAGSALGARRHRPQPAAPRDHGYVAVGGHYIMRASLQRSPASASYRDKVQDSLLRREVRGYFLPQHAATLQTTRVTLRSNNPLPALQSSSEWELDLSTPTAEVQAGGYRRTTTQMSAVAAIALVASYLSDLFQGQRSRPIEAAQAEQTLSAAAPSRSLQPEVSSRWYLANLATPSGHPFRAGANSGSVSGGGSGGSGSSGGSIAGSHTNVAPTALVSVSPHTNTFTAHTNTDSRPIPGPY